MRIMTMQHRPTNVIEQRKQDVRKYSALGLISVSGGVAGGAVLALLASEWTLFALGLVIAVAGGGYCWHKVKSIVNYRDQG